MAEFKKLSEVERVETTSNNATVLVEEGGEIKRVPKSAVGGAGGYVIRLSESYRDDDGAYCFDESYDELYDILIAGGSVWVDYTDAPDYVSPRNLSIQDATNYGPERVTITAWQMTDIGLMLYDFWAYKAEGYTIYYPNGSHNLESIESAPPS